MANSVRLYFQGIIGAGDQEKIRRTAGEGMAPPSEAVEPEAFWKSILSEDPVKIRAVWNTLPAAERDAVRAHLRTMAGGEGWTPGQKAAAALALRILEDYVRGDGQS